MLEIFATNLIIHEFLHFLVALVIAAFIIWKLKSWKLVILVFLVTFLTDLDHLTEIFMVRGLNPQWLFSTFRGNFFRESGKMTIFLHSWELIPVILFVGKTVRQWPLAVATVFALAGHYLVDQVIYSTLYGMPLLEYSLIYRAWHRFNWYEICGDC